MPAILCGRLSRPACHILKQRSSDCLRGRSAHFMSVMVTHAQKRWQGFHL